MMPMHLPYSSSPRSWQSLTLGSTRMSNSIFGTVGAGVVKATFFRLADVGDSAGARVQLGGHGDD